jgi:hypothetical protein
MFDVSPSVTRHSQRGIALVITLIMLAVTLVMAVAFLAIARRERNAATTATDTAVARLADDAALAAAQAQIAANILATTNPYNYSLLVSTNYQNGAGFFTGVASPTNVNYDFYNGTGLGPVSGNDLVQNIANLYLLPRAPVFVNNPNTGSNDFRFYLDLNRNGAFDPNGSVTNVDNLGNAILGANGSPLVTVQGDPEWVGVLEHPDQPHGPNNPFVARYAFLAQPAGNSLDLNYIHNQTLNTGLGVQDGFFRNESVGSWELNLAAFLTDLNTNEWDTAGAPYLYQRPGGFPNSGTAFSDALSLLSWRYAGNYNSLAVPFGNFYTALANGNVDDYTLGYLMTNTALPAVFPPNNAPWAGSDNTNRYFALPSDVFDPTKNLGNFPVRLAAAGKSVATYDRYTYYRMLDELGTDSTADDSRMNLNYSNAVVTYNGSGMMTSVTIIPGAETNATPWRPLDFFNAAADRMLRYYTANWASANFGAFTNTFGASVTGAFGVASIPVYINGQMVYTPAVNRILQLAANIYDASTTNFYPSVFRPTFLVTNQNGFKNVYINGYNYVDNVAWPGDLRFSIPFDASTIASTMPVGPVPSNDNIYGVPWIIGAKKWMPNFNQFYMLNAVEVTRKVQVTKPNIGALVSSFTTNQMYIFSITNYLGCSLWNSYTNTYNTANGFTIVASDLLSMSLTNSDPNFTSIGFNNYQVVSSNLPTFNSWTNTVWSASPPNVGVDAYGAFVVPFNGAAVLLTNSIYRYGGFNGNAAPYLDPFNPSYQTNVFTPALPQFGLLTTNRLQVFILDGTHVLDYVHFAGPDSSRNLNAELADPNSQDQSGNLYLWSTNPVTAGSPNGTPEGVVAQVMVSQGPPATPANYNPKFWQIPPNMPAGLPKTPAGAQQFFAAFFNDNRLQYGVFINNGKRYTNTLLQAQAPYTPTRLVYDYETWQANDPLVHYLASDLNYNNPGTTGLQRSDQPDTAIASLNISLYGTTKRWSPWGANYNIFTTAPNNYVDATWQTALKDSLVWRPDNWDFPNGMYPSVGWLGRVHRGTPWQTVYLKSSDILTNTGTAIGMNSWAQWTGDLQNNFDATNSAPLQDAGLFDLFSTAPNGNATHGTLSVNQVHLAAWSAVFSGLMAMTNASADFNGYTAAPAVAGVVIPPAGPDSVNSAVALLVNGTLGINATRANTVNADGVTGAFEHVGDILRTPALAELSPFLNTGDTLQKRYGISDELYEWLPQQTLGLLRASSTPRYVVYCYGQTLRPAPGGVVTASGQYFGLVTNYQITAESAARAVIRVDNATTKAPRVIIESYVPLPPK